MPGITKQQAQELYAKSSLLELGLQGQEITQKLHDGNIRTYIIERNINYTNVCQCCCSFCAFSASPRSGGGYVLDFEQISEKIKPLLALGGTQILLQGGMNPELPLSWYEELLGRIKERFQDLHIHAFSPPEIVFFSQRFNMGIDKVIERLGRAGLDTIPGGGAEILVNRVRRLISPAKCTTEQWLEVMREAHRQGMCTTATMMFGHVETPAERIAGPPWRPSTGADRTPSADSTIAG